MPRTVDELADLIAPHLTTDQNVRSQREYFAHALWLRCLPTEVSSRLDIAAWPARSTRQDLLDQAQHLTDATDALKLYIRVAGWGANKPQPVWRCARAFADPRLAEVLIAARDHLHEVGPVDAYWWMLPGGRHHVHGLGPAFFSKWSYFCGYPAQATDVALDAIYPLILDARVARALQLGTSYSRNTYATYLDTAHTLATELDTTPHCVEHALFTVGRA